MGTAVLSLLLNPDVQHVLFAALGAVIGYYVKHFSAGNAIPPELQDLVAALIAARKQKEAAQQMADLNEHLPHVVPSLAPATQPTGLPTVQVPAVVAPAPAPHA